MTFEEYQKKAETTAVYPNKGKNLIYTILGLVGESGEVAEKVKKIIRDKGGQINREDKQLLAKELGDVLWYLAMASQELGLSLEYVADLNVEKLQDRYKREKIHGQGDER
jgi:NTP pyrophosphatase (non-canonical NTP hydrolase)